MTEYSWNFACSPAAGDAGPLTAEALAAARLFLGNFDPQGAGVIYWTDGTPANTLFPGTPPGLSANALDGLLVPSNPSAGVVRFASGVGMVLGYLYVSDSDVDFDINADPGQANATDLIVLRRSSLASTPQIRLARKKASSPSSTATVQQDATIWETAVVEVLLDGSGNYSSFTNVAQYVQTPLLPPTRTVTRFVQPVSGFEDDGATYPALAMYDATEDLFGVIMPDSQTSVGGVNIIVPPDYVSGFTVKAAVMSLNTGDVYAQINYSGGLCGESVATVTGSNSYSAVSIAPSVHECIKSTAIAGVERGDILSLKFRRQGAHASDTLTGDLVLLGFTYEYQGRDGELPA